MKRNEAFPSEFLKPDDIAGTGETYTMGTIEMREFEDPATKEKESKPVLSLSGIEKKLILNRTNWDRIAGLYGDETNEWQGKEIVLHLESVSAFGKTSDVIRVKNK